MSEFQDTDLRIADSEREAALAVLGEHMSAGRLNIDEYGERSAQVATAKTRGDLRAQFSDLPEPHPQFGTGMPTFGAGSPIPVATTPVPAPGRQMTSRRPFRAVLAGMVPLAAIIGVGLFFITHFWIFFLLPAAVVVLSSAMGGGNPRGGNRHRHDWDDRRRDRFDRTRDRHDHRDGRRRNRHNY